MIKPKFLLIGDSHAAAIGRAAQEANLAIIGGPIGSGRDFFAPFFAIKDGSVQWLTVEAQEHMAKFLQQAKADTFETAGLPVLSTLGFSMHFLATRHNWQLYQDATGQVDPAFLQSNLFEALIDQMLFFPMHFYRHAIASGLKVYGVLAPQRIPVLSDPAVLFAAQRRMIAQYSALGLTLLDVRPTTTQHDGLLLPEYCQPNDPLHANTRFGHLVLSQFAALS